jgi:hypothetical protein
MLKYTFKKGILLASIFILYLISLILIQKLVIFLITFPLVLSTYYLTQMRLSCPNCYEMVYNDFESPIFLQWNTSFKWLLRPFWIPTECKSCGEKFNK